MKNTESEHKSAHWSGLQNKLIRYWFYILKGLDTFNNFKYLIGAIFALYWTLKMNNPLILVGMFCICIPILFIVGYYTVHHIGKVVDWLNVEYSTYWSRKSMEWQERQVKALESIEEKIK